MPQPRGFWTPARDALLRRLYPTIGPVATAAKLGVTVVAVRSRAPRIGVDTGRCFWTPAEQATICRMHPTHTAAEMAAALPGRSRKAVEQQIHALGLRKLADHTPTLPRVAELVAAGLTDTAIAKQLGIARREVTRLRADRLALKTDPAAILAAKRRGVRVQAARLGIPVGGALRRIAFHKFAAENGWPSELRPRAVQILNVLAEHGPRTKNQLAEALGVPWRGRASRDVLMCRGPGGSYLAQLQAAGLVARIEGGGLCPSKGQGKGRLPSLYTLTPAAIAYKEEHGNERAEQVTEEAVRAPYPDRGAGAHATGTRTGRVGRGDEGGGARRVTTPRCNGDRRQAG